MRDKFWLTPRMTAAELDKICRDNQRAAGDETTDLHDDTSSEGEECSLRDDADYIDVMPPIKSYLSFIVPKPDTQSEFTIEMSVYYIRTGAPDFDGKLCMEYIPSIFVLEIGTIIRIDPNNSTELWRRLPLTNWPQGVEITLTGKDGIEQSSKHFPGQTTLGDMYAWLSSEAARLRLA